MATELCKKCGSPMEVKRNGKNGFFAGCSTPEKHVGATPKPEAIPEPEPQPSPIETPVKSGFLDSWF